MSNAIWIVLSLILFLLLIILGVAYILSLRRKPSASECNLYYPCSTSPPSQCPSYYIYGAPQTGTSGFLSQGTVVFNGDSGSSSINTTGSNLVIASAGTPIGAQQWYINTYSNGYSIQNVGSGEYITPGNPATGISNSTLLTLSTTPYAFNFNLSTSGTNGTVILDQNNNRFNISGSNSPADNILGGTSLMLYDDQSQVYPSNEIFIITPVQ